MTFSVLISSSNPINSIALDLKNTFNRYGITTLVDSDILMPGVNFQEAIKKQIQQSDCLLVIIESCDLRSDNIVFELGIASGLSKIVIPFVEKGANIPPALAQKQLIIFDRENPKQSYEHVALYLSKLKIEKENKDALGSLLLLGLGIILLGALSSNK